MLGRHTCHNLRYTVHVVKPALCRLLSAHSGSCISVHRSQSRPNAASQSFGYLNTVLFFLVCFYRVFIYSFIYLPGVRRPIRSNQKSVRWAKKECDVAAWQRKGAEPEGGHDVSCEPGPLSSGGCRNDETRGLDLRGLLGLHKHEKQNE